MKKLLTLAVVAATIGFAQAATLSWSAMKIYQPGTETALSGGLAFLFVTEQSKNFGAGTTTVDAVTKALADGAELVTDGEGKATGLKSGTTTIDIAASGATTSTGMLSGNTGYYGNFGDGDSLKAFAVIFDSADFATAKKYIATDVKEAKWTSSTGSKMLGFGSQAPVNGVEKWAAVPGPATATLALAGLALLLKRRRA